MTEADFIDLVTNVLHTLFNSLSSNYLYSKKIEVIQDQYNRLDDYDVDVVDMLRDNVQLPSAEFMKQFYVYQKIKTVIDYAMDGINDDKDKITYIHNQIRYLDKPNPQDCSNIDINLLDFIKHFPAFNNDYKIFVEHGYIEVQSDYLRWKKSKRLLAWYCHEKASPEDKQIQWTCAEKLFRCEVLNKSYYNVDSTKLSLDIIHCIDILGGKK